MASFALAWLFLVLGALGLVLGTVRWIGAGRLVPQARAWILLGAIFAVVGAWLWHARPPLA